MEQFFYLKRFIDELNDSLHDIIRVMNESQHDNDIINSHLGEFKRNKEFIELSGKAISEIENFALTKNQEHIDRFMKIFDMSLRNLDASFFFINQKLVDSNNHTGVNYLSRGYMNIKAVNRIIDSLFRINQHHTTDKSKEFINPESKEKKVTQINKPKGYINQLTHEQRQFLDELLNDGFKDSHVYRELKTKHQIITLTESEFVDYLNRFHERKFLKSKRFTSSQNLSIPIELSLKVEGFKSKITKK